MARWFRAGARAPGETPSRKFDLCFEGDAGAKRSFLRALRSAP
jgi:hypothetical protein